MKVSIIVPVYNTKEYLQRCLDSLLAQDEPDIEIILIDDGSTDGSGRICELYAERDTRIRVMHKENGGVSSARNLGLDILTGSCFCFIDSDDYVAPNYISLLLKNMNSVNCDISVCGLSRNAACKGGNKLSVFDRPDALLSLFNGVSGIKGYIGGKLFKTDIMKKHHIRFDEEQAIAEDLLFIFDYLQFCREQNSVCMTAVELYYYERESGGALTQRGSADTFQEHWRDPVTACDKLLLKIPRSNKKLRRAAELEKVMQCVTLIRIMACYGLIEEIRPYKKYVSRHLCAYLFSKSFTLRKKISAAAVLICPQIITKRR